MNQKQTNESKRTNELREREKKCIRSASARLESERRKKGNEEEEEEIPNASKKKKN
jgi:hypothetical protein